MLGTRAYGFERLSESIRVEVGTESDTCYLDAPLLIGADGANSRVARWMGREHKHEIVPAIKADITFHRRGTDSIEIFVGERVAPGWFGWIIPIQDGLARIGTGATRAPRQCFEVLLDLIEQRFGKFTVNETRRAPLPLGPARDFVSDRVMLVGAAARQTKPTTGGGIYFGVRAAQLAAATAINAIAQTDCSHRVLAEYERAWHQSDGRELAYGDWLRKGFRLLSDSDFDMLIQLLNKPWAQSLISRLGDMDFPSRLFTPLVTTIGRWITSPKMTGARRCVSLRA
jgi:flavin-dependent dehydrogenase